jgi:dsRNA-specific ribonuclease
VGWLEIGEGFLLVPRFEEHNGKSAKRRAQDVVRKMSAREADKCPQTKRTKSGLEKNREEKSNRMAKPSLEQILGYGLTLDPPFRKAEAFISHYESNGWKVGKNPMKDWKASVRTWQQTEKEKRTIPDIIKSNGNKRADLWD